MGHKTILALALIAATFLLLNIKPESHSHIQDENDVDIQKSFKAWLTINKKLYTTESEMIFRLNKYRANYRFVKNHNKRFEAGLETYEVEMNKFADLDQAEFAATYLRMKKSSDRLTVTQECKGTVNPISNPPTSFDWESKGAVNRVKNQGQCGSCWAFSAIGALEGLAKIQKGTLLNLSEQQLVDCAGGSYENEGCNGGYMDTAFWYVIDNGITTEEQYPYTARDQTCKYKESMKAYQIASCAEVVANSTSKLIEAVANQPVAVAVEADDLGFQLYRSGVFKGKCGTDLNHGVLATGYGALDGTDYWKVKNSWGQNWGNQGYIYLWRNGDGPGQCGIQMQNAVPLGSL